MKKKIILVTLSLLLNCLWAELEIRDASYIPMEGYNESSYEIGKEERTIYVGSEVLLSSRDVADAQVSEFDNRHVVNVVFTSEGSKKLRKITEKRIRKPLAFIVDGRLVSAPTIMNPLSRNAMISGSFSEAEAKDLAQQILD